VKKTKTALCIYVKTIGHGAIIPGLAKTIGKDSTEQIYIKMLILLLEELKHIKKVLGDKLDIYWAVEEGEKAFCYWPYFKCIAQSGDSPGERQSSVFTFLKPEYQNVVFMSADCPDINANVILEAIERLKTDEVVFGPTLNGGYYLVGSQKYIPYHTWVKVPFFQSNTLVSFVKSLDNEFRYSFLPELSGIESLSDFNYVKIVKSNNFHYGNY
jgi:glycosyltransferase A (GT-A) superfamily protein (DUF2064 family)